MHETIRIEIVSEGKRRIGINDEYLNITCNYFKKKQRNINKSQKDYYNYVCLTVFIIFKQM